jgi:aryl-alcohol dehydrogenase-like predicted oxidoreductase
VVFRPINLGGVAEDAVAPGGLLQRPPNILLIPGTSSVDHLRENVAGAALQLSPGDLEELDSIAGRAGRSGRVTTERIDGRVGRPSIG